MESRRFLVFWLVILMGFLGSSQAYRFVVGGKDGWVVNPRENYNHWAERSRFRVNDTLYFKYEKGSDSVLAVSKEDYESCNNKNPVISLTDGESIFKFGHSGPFYFISGNVDNCKKGQKLIVVVLALTHRSHPIPPVASPPPPVASPPSPVASSPPPPLVPSSSPSQVGTPPPVSVPSPVSPPMSASPPKVVSPVPGSTESGGSPPPDPKHKSSSARFGSSMCLVMSFVSVVLGSFVGLV